MGLFVKGAGFFNDAYDLFVMSSVNVVLKQEYPDEYTTKMQSLVSSAVLIGAVIGQITFGYFADTMGRRKMMIISCLLLIVGGILSASAYGPTATSLLYLLALWRFVLGIGIGAEYPLSATSTAEGAIDTISRGPQVAMTFSLQGWGSLTAAICANFLVQVFANTPPYSDSNLEIIWRTLFAIGALPSLGIFYWRWKSEESQAFLADQEARTREGRKKTLEFKFALKNYGWRLLGAAGNWFLFDVIFYAQSLFSATILEMVSLGTDDETLQVVTLKNVFLALIALPGYLVSVLLINKLGRKWIQIQGFLCMAVIFIILGAFYDAISGQSLLFLALYASSFFFSNFGPNVTTFIIPTEIFPTAIRASCHGVSAAAGKVGGALGGALFSPIEDAIGIQWVFIICGVIAIFGAILSFFFTSSMVRDLEELEVEFLTNLEKEDEKTRGSLIEAMRESLQGHSEKDLITRQFSNLSAALNTQKSYSGPSSEKL